MVIRNSAAIEVDMPWGPWCHKRMPIERHVLDIRCNSAASRSVG